MLRLEIMNNLKSLLEFTGDQITSQADLKKRFASSVRIAKTDERGFYITEKPGGVHHLYKDGVIRFTANYQDGAFWDTRKEATEFYEGWKINKNTEHPDIKKWYEIYNCNMSIGSKVIIKTNSKLYEAEFDQETIYMITYLYVDIDGLNIGINEGDDSYSCGADGYRIEDLEPI